MPTKPQTPAAHKGRAAKPKHPGTPDAAALRRATEELAREREAVERLVAELRALRQAPVPLRLPPHASRMTWRDALILTGALAVLMLLALLVIFS